MIQKRPTNISVYQTMQPEAQLYNKLKNNRTLAPLLYIPTYQTRNFNNQGKFIVRKASKSEQNKSTRRGNFYLYKGNNQALIKSILEQLGFTETNNKQYCRFIWYQNKQIPKKDYLLKQFSSIISNYLPHHYQITNKQYLYENISKYQPLAVGTIIPKTFIIDFKDTLINIQNNLMEFLIQYFKKLGMTHGPKKHSNLYIANSYGQFCIPFSKIHKVMRQRANNDDSQNSETKTKNKGSNKLWIVKPSSLNRGQGIQVISHLHQLQKMLSQDSRQISVKMYQSDEKTVSSFVIQQYIMNPLLYEGYKFDIRVWALLKTTKTNGLEVYIYKLAYSRLASHKYSREAQEKNHDEPTNNEQSKYVQLLTRSTESKRQKHPKLAQPNDLFIHLTNNAFQKNCKQYGILHDGNQLLLSDLIIKLNIPNLTQHYLFQKFEKILILLISSCRQKLLSKSNYGNFQLIGLDFMIDVNLNVWLIEANCNPCLEESSMILKMVLPKMVKDMFRIVRINKIMGMKDNKEESQISNEDNYWKKIM